MSDGMHNYIQRNELCTSNQRTNCCTRLNIISKSHLGKAVRHTHRVVHEFPGESEDMTMAIFVSSTKKEKERNGKGGTETRL